MRYIPTAMSVDPDAVPPEVTVAWQVQLPFLAASTWTVLMYVAMFKITAGTGLAGINITSGPVHTVFTITGRSTAGLNSTVQVRVTLEPAITFVGVVTVTAIGAGTEGRKKLQQIFCECKNKSYNLFPPCKHPPPPHSPQWLDMCRYQHERPVVERTEADCCQ